MKSIHPQSRISLIRTYVGWALLVVAFLACSAVSVRNTFNVEKPAKPQLLITHWQLEARYREALQSVIDDYNRLHPDIEVRQCPLSEGIYAQWLNTQLIAGTAPDICEMGVSALVTRDDSTVKYYMPLGDFLSEPNPYNSGTVSTNVPWRDTFLDGARGGFRDGLQEYFGVPTARVCTRLFYNKDLLRKATGSDNPPNTLDDWLAKCDAVAALGPNYLGFVSCYSLDPVINKLQPTFMSGFEPQVDLDLDGTLSPIETYVAYLNGTIHLDAPPLTGLWETGRAIGKRMQQGFSAMDRQQAQFRFLNGEAGFMYTGSWDASGIFLLAKQKGFSVGVIELPVISTSDSTGQFARGPSDDAAASAACTYGVYKDSKQADRAIDFLRYLTSVRGNEKLNQLSEWPPMTVGAEPSDLMRPFTAGRPGYSSVLKLNFGANASNALSSNLINFFQGDAPLSETVQAYSQAIRDPQFGGDYAWANATAERQRDVRGKEQLLAQQAALELSTPGSTDLARYRRALAQQISKRNGLDYAYQFRRWRGKDVEMP